MALADELGAKFYQLISNRTGPCSNHSDDAPCEECLRGGVEAATEWLTKHSCATCRWAEWRAEVPAIREPIIENPITPDVFSVASDPFPVCRHAWAMGGAFLGSVSVVSLPPDFGCTKYEAKP